MLGWLGIKGKSESSKTGNAAAIGQPESKAVPDPNPVITPNGGQAVDAPDAPKDLIAVTDGSSPSNPLVKKETDTGTVLSEPWAKTVSNVAHGAKLSISTATAVSDVAFAGARWGTSLALGAVRSTLVSALGSARGTRAVPDGEGDEAQTTSYQMITRLRPDLFDPFHQVLDSYAGKGIDMVNHAFSMAELFTYGTWHFANSTVRLTLKAAEETVGVFDGIFGSNETSRAITALVQLVREEFASSEPAAKSGGILSQTISSIALMGGVTKAITAYACLQIMASNAVSEKLNLVLVFDGFATKHDNGDRPSETTAARWLLPPPIKKALPIEPPTENSVPQESTPKAPTQLETAAQETQSPLTILLSLPGNVPSSNDVDSSNGDPSSFEEAKSFILDNNLQGEDVVEIDDGKTFIIEGDGYHALISTPIIALPRTNLQLPKPTNLLEEFEHFGNGDNVPFTRAPPIRPPVANNQARLPSYKHSENVSFMDSISMDFGNMHAFELQEPRPSTPKRPQVPTRAPSWRDFVPPPRPPGSRSRLPTGHKWKTQATAPILPAISEVDSFRDEEDVESFVSAKSRQPNESPSDGESESSDDGPSKYESFLSTAFGAPSTNKQLLQPSPISQALCIPKLDDVYYPLPHLFDNLSRYLRFSSAAYGQEFMSVFGIGKIRELYSTDRSIPANHYAFAMHTSVHVRDVIHSSFVDDENKLVTDPKSAIVFYVVIDREASVIVVAIRGTLSFSDLVTDMKCEFTSHNGHHVHAGMLEIVLKLIAKDSSLFLAVRKALQDNPDFGLVLVGHSLGGGCASLMALEWATRAQNTSTHNLRTPFVTSSKSGLPVNRPIHCFAFGPPGSATEQLAESGRGLITSLVNGDDIIPVLSIGLVRDLKNVTIHMLDSANKGLCERIIARRLGLQSVATKDEKGANTQSGASAPSAAELAVTHAEEDFCMAVVAQLRAKMSHSRLIPCGDVFWMNAAETEAVSVGAGNQKVQHSIVRATIHYCADVSGMFKEPRFSARMMSDHTPMSYEAAINALELARAASQ